LWGTFQLSLSAETFLVERSSATIVPERFYVPAVCGSFGGGGSAFTIVAPKRFAHGIQQTWPQGSSAGFLGFFLHYANEF